ncbi:hypothetical protein [Enterococcus gilvus]|uniref:hypothetical protein n=1 Tax=Enterococcus gilvus TaxID=160453 RepID=UPI003EDA06A3
MTIKKLKLTTILLLGVFLVAGCLVMTGCGKKDTNTDTKTSISGDKVEKGQQANVGESSGE